MSLSCFTLLLASHPGGHSAFRSLAKHRASMFRRRTAYRQRLQQAFRQAAAHDMNPTC
jgi:hypothetical protein